MCEQKNKEMKKRYKQQYYAYHEDCLVVCPSCGKDATVKSKMQLL